MHSNSSAAPSGSLVHHSPWAVHRRVIGALFLREMLTRYGRNNIGFLWLFAEPMLFTFVLTAVWAATRTVHGSQIPIVAFAVTGWPSAMLWRNIPGRLIGAVRSNRALLHHRQVTIMDLYLSRILLEQMGTTTSFIGVSIILYAFGFLIPPEDPLQVLIGWLFLAWFGAALGLTVAGLADKVQVIANIWPPLSYVMMPLSGIAFIADAAPPGLRDVMVWNPPLNALEFLRDGWFGSMFRPHYDIPYLVTFNLCLTLVGLALARQVGLEGRDE